MNNSKQDKYNPDVVKKYESLTRERESSSYTFSKQVYKGITNDFPNQITKPEDLKIKASEPDFDLIKKNMEASLKEREQEKLAQEKLLKELSDQNMKKKLVINLNKSSEVPESHQDMKTSHKKFNLDKEKSVLNDVIDFLKKI
jgi:hypothetical protein